MAYYQYLYISLFQQKFEKEKRPKGGGGGFGDST